MIGVVLDWTNGYLFGLLLRRALLVGAEIELISWKLLVDFAEVRSGLLHLSKVLPVLVRFHLFPVFHFFHDVEYLGCRHPSLSSIFLLLLIAVAIGSQNLDIVFENGLLFEDGRTPCDGPQGIWLFLPL